MNGADNLIKVFRLLVSQMTPVIQITENVVDGDNWKLSMCRTYWLTKGMTIGIGGIDYKIVDFIFGEYIIISGPSQPVVTSFTLEAPGFYHGARRKVNADFKGVANLKRPFVYLPVTETVTPEAYDSDIAYVADIKPLFLRSYTKSRDTTEQQQAEVIEPMYDMAELFIELVTEQGGYFNRPKNVKGRPQMNFGEQAIWGSDRMIFDQPLSGIELRFNLEVLIDGACRCDDSASVTCAPVPFFLNDVFQKDLPSGSQFKAKVIDTDGDPVVATFNTTTNEISVPASSGSASIDITINEQPALSGVSANTNINVVGSDLEFKGTFDGTKQNIADSPINHNGDLLSPLPSELTKFIATVDSEGNPISVVTVDTPTILLLTTPDATNTFQGSPIQGGLAQGSKAITSAYENGTPIGTLTTDTKSALHIEIPNPVTPELPVYNFLPWNTGANDYGTFQTNDDAATNRGASADWFLLNNPNPFGHLYKLTGKTGGYYDHLTASYKDVSGGASTYAGSFPDDVILAWSSYQPGGTLVLAMHNSFLTGLNQTTYITNQPYTLAGESDWMLPNENEGNHFKYKGVFRNWWNYPPISFNMVSSAAYLWSNEKDTAGGGYQWYAGGFRVTNSTAVSAAFRIRYYTLSSLGL